MRLGVLPSRQRALQQAVRKARKFDEFRSRTRRGFVLTALGGLSASVGAFFLGRSAAAPAVGLPQPLNDEVRLLRRWATGPLANLVSAYPTFLLLLERNGDAPSFAGYARLVDVAVERDDATLARHLLQSATTAPSELASLTRLLEPVARR